MKKCSITGYECKGEFCIWWREYAGQCAFLLIADTIEEVSRNER